MKKWNLWSIKNRWLRAAVAWPGVVVTAVGMLIFILCATVVFALKGAWDAVADGYAEGFSAAERKEWASILHDAWQAMTAKDRPA